MALLIKKKDKQILSQNIKMLEPEKIYPALNKTAWKILKIIDEEPLYPNQIAKNLKMNEQKIYYHIRKLSEAGLVEVVKEEQKRGGLCKYFSTSAHALGLSISEKWEPVILNIDNINRNVKKFFQEFIKNGVFNGSVVVGSPDPHGPFLTSSRDGHYAVHLGMFLGGFMSLEKRFTVKLDTEVKAEDAVKRNLILVGGPVTNIITMDVNDYLKIRFNWENKWEIKSEKKIYNGENIGLISKIKNPWDKEKSIILFSGLRFKGTKACIIGITQHHEKILKTYKPGRDFYCVINGLDKDGDGKIDDIEILESY